ncbi:MAG: hypothetical protein KDI98_00460, partial [Hyphomicrobiaceae bacterium]|nr:hypothetical protein [Hyphomicrobiaceae bacterium]
MTAIALFDFADHAEIGRLLADRRPAWLWAEDPDRILWSNPAGVLAMRAPGARALLAMRFPRGVPARRQLERVAAQAGDETAPSVEMLRFFIGSSAQTFVCLCRKVKLADGRVGVLTLGSMPVDTGALSQRLERVLFAASEGVKTRYGLALAQDGTLIARLGLEAPGSEAEMLMRDAVAEAGDTVRFSGLAANGLRIDTVRIIAEDKVVQLVLLTDRMAGDDAAQPLEDIVVDTPAEAEAPAGAEVPIEAETETETAAPIEASPIAEPVDAPVFPHIADTPLAGPAGAEVSGPVDTPDEAVADIVTEDAPSDEAPEDIPAAVVEAPALAIPVRAGITADALDKIRRRAAERFTFEIDTAGAVAVWPRFPSGDTPGLFVPQIGEALPTAFARIGLGEDPARTTIEEAVASGRMFTGATLLWPGEGFKVPLTLTGFAARNPDGSHAGHRGFGVLRWAEAEALEDVVEDAPAQETFIEDVPAEDAAPQTDEAPALADGVRVLAGLAGADALLSEDASADAGSPEEIAEAIFSEDGAPAEEMPEPVTAHEPDIEAEEAETPLTVAPLDIPSEEAVEAPVEEEAGAPLEPGDALPDGDALLPDVTVAPLDIPAEELPGQDNPPAETPGAEIADGEAAPDPIEPEPAAPDTEAESEPEAELTPEQRSPFAGAVITGGPLAALFAATRARRRREARSDAPEAREIVEDPRDSAEPDAAPALDTALAAAAEAPVQDDPETDEKTHVAPGTSAETAPPFITDTPFFSDAPDDAEPAAPEEEPASAEAPEAEADPAPEADLSPAVPGAVIAALAGGLLGGLKAPLASDIAPTEEASGAEEVPAETVLTDEPLTEEPL